MERRTEAADGNLPIIAVSRSALPGTGLPGLAEIGRIREWPQEQAPDRTELADLCADATALLCVNGDRIDEDFLDGLPTLRLVAVGSVGYDTVDAAAAAERGVVVTNTPGVLHEATADLAFGLILAARRRIVEADRWVRSGHWQQGDLQAMLGYDVHGATIGIIGLGEIGEAVARRAHGFGMRVIHHNRTPGDRALSAWRPLVDLLEEADIISIHLPINASTRGLIGARELALMKPTATLVNTGRGGIVDEAALVDALRSGTIGSAGLDVQAKEPNPDPHDPLLSVENCVVVPHIGSATFAARAGMVDLAAANIEDLLVRGKVRTPVPESRRIAGTA